MVTGRISPRSAAPILVGVVAFAAGLAALEPGLEFWDTGELQAVAPLLGTAHPTGFPTYVILGWLASVILQPFGEPAFRMNVFSAVCVALAAAVTVDLVRALTRSTILGVVAGLGMALTPIAWNLATHAEAHTLHLALLAILLRLLVSWEARVRPEFASPAHDPAGTTVSDGAGSGKRRDRGDRFLVAAAVVFGLAMGNHSLTLLLALPVGLYVLAVDPQIWRRGRLVLGCVAALAITLVVVYAELPLRAGILRAPLVYGRPETWDGFWYVTLAEQFRGSLQDPFGALPRKFGDLVSLTMAEFGVLAPFVPIGFVATAMRWPRYALLTGSAVFITCFFAASYENAEIQRYYLGPILVAWTWLAVLASLAADAVAVAAGEPVGTPEADVEAEAANAGWDEGTPAVAGAYATPATAWSAIAALGLGVLLIAPTVLASPARFAQVDHRRVVEAQTWTDHVMDTLDPGAVLVSWWSFSTPLWYEQLVDGRRPDVAIIDDRTRLDENLGEITDVIDANLGKRPVYVIRLDPREVALLASRYELDYIDGFDATMLTRVVGPKVAS
jgi:hypothetical protein